jgi:hypothetical protein
MDLRDGNPTESRGRWTRLLLAAALLVLSVYQVAAVVRALQPAPDLSAQVALPLVPAAIGAGLWACLLCAAAIFTFRAPLERAQRWGLTALFGFAAYSSARLAIFAQADYDRGRIPFLLALLLVLALPVLLMWGRAFRRGRS